MVYHNIESQFDLSQKLIFFVFFVFDLRSDYCDLQERKPPYFCLNTLDYMGNTRRL